MKTINFKHIKAKDVFIMLLILGVTFGYHLEYYFFSESFSEEVEFDSIHGILYYSKMRLLIIMFCLIWYFTSKSWWKHSILVIITIELLKLISTVNTNQPYVDVSECFTSLPITLPIILLLLFISNKLNTYNLAKETRSVINKEIDDVFFELHEDEKNNLQFLEQKFLELKSNKFNKNSDKYLADLISLRNEFYKTEL